ncbi:zinc finger, C2H2 [Tanacetum coccineum]
MTIDMKKTNRKRSGNKRTTMIVKHLEENTDQYEFKCKTCNRRFKTYQALGGHTVSSHRKIKPENKYNDALCMLSLNTIPTVSSCLYQCKICTKEFETKQALGGHMNIHRFEKGMNVVEEKGPSQQEAALEKVESDLESGSSVLTIVELERRKAEEDERVRVRREMVLAAKQLQLFLD